MPRLALNRRQSMRSTLDWGSPMEAWLIGGGNGRPPRAFSSFFTVPIRNKKLVCSSRICSVSAIADILKCGNNTLGRTLWKEFLQSLE